MCGSVVASAEPLPDNRVYELVTPVGDDNADVYVQPSEIVNGNSHGIETSLPFLAATDGDAVVYAGSPTAGGTGSDGAGGGNEYLATRAPGGGWVQSTLTPPDTSSDTIYLAFSSDLSVGVLTLSGYGSSGQLSAEVVPRPSEEHPGEEFARYDVLYARNDEDGTYRPLYTQGPLDRAWYRFGEASELSLTGAQEVLYAGASGDFSHMLFEANDAMRVNPLGGVTPVERGRRTEQSVRLCKRAVAAGQCTTGWGQRTECDVRRAETAGDVPRT